MPPSSSPRLTWQSVLALLLLAAAVVAFEYSLNRQYVGSDDAFIHLRYIDNLRTGNGFGFNPDVPSNGSTSPLWVVTAAAVTRYAGDVIQATRALAVILFLASLPIFYALMIRLTDSKAIALAASAVYVSDPWLLKWAGSTMEASLASLLVLLTAFFVVQSDKKHYLMAASVTFGLATLVKPEMALMFLLFLLVRIGFGGTPSTRLSTITTAVVAYAAAVAPWLIFSLATFQTALPNTFFAKTLHSSNDMWPIAWYFLRIEAVGYWWAWLAGAAVLAIVLVQRFRATIGNFEFRDMMVLLFWTWSVAILIYYTISRLQTPSTRYLQIMTPILIAIGFHSLSRLLSTGLPVVALRPRHWFLAVAVGGVLVYNIIFNALVVLPSSRDFTDGVLDTYRQVGEWISENTVQSSRVAIHIDVGAIGYYSNRQVIDLAGLNTVEVIPYLPDGLSYLFVAKPEYLVVTSGANETYFSEEGRFDGIATALYSVPFELGLRARLQSATGGRPQERHEVTVYRLDWT